LPETGIVSEAEFEARNLDAEAKTLENEGGKMSKKSFGKKAEASIKRAEAKRAEAKQLEEEAKGLEAKAEACKNESEAGEYKTKAEAKRTKAEASKKEAVKFEEEAKKYKADSDGDTDGDGIGDGMTKKAEAAKHAAALETAYENLPDVIKNIVDKAGESVKFQARTQEEMEQFAANANQGIAPKPGKKIDVKNFSKTYTELAADPEGKRIIERVKTSFGSVLEGNDHFLLLQSMINDRSFSEVFKKMTFTQQTKFANYQNANVHELARMCASGSNLYEFKTGKKANMATFGTTDNALASPENLAIEWLNIIYFTLFPSDEWKAEIPIFAATVTEKNRGVIWTNVKADPDVHEGSMPSNLADYDQSTVDTAVSMNLKPFWLQPMIWTPELMAQVRYDMMGAGWSQALMKLRTQISNYLIYELASLIPSSSILSTIGSSFTVTPGTPNSFKLNPSFSSSTALGKAKITDAARVEQLFESQNYELPEGASIIMVLDPVMGLQIKMDPDTKSLLTRFVRSGKDELDGYSKVGFRKRSQLALYDLATNQVVDPTGIIPATAVSAGLFFIPSQVGIGLGNLDVFMVQKPSAYGIEMSCNTRQGIALMRDNGYGAGLYPYAAFNSNNQ
jgi:hypothetical protein